MRLDLTEAQWDWILGGVFVLLIVIALAAAFWPGRRTPAEGRWVAPGPVEHRCMLPRDMPPGTRSGLIFRCSVCDAEWTWRT